MGTPEEQKPRPPSLLRSFVASVPTEPLSALATIIGLLVGFGASGLLSYGIGQVRHSSSSAPSPEAVVQFGGKITDATTGHPVSFARIAFQPIGQSETWLETVSDSDGLYAALLSLRSGTKPTKVTLKVNAADYVPYTNDLDLRASTEENIALTRLAHPKSDENANPGHVVAQSPAIASTIGSGWSDWHLVCAHPPSGKYQLGRVYEFKLVGDRSCGAWSECELVSADSHRVCYRFRVQGHSELSHQAAPGVTTGYLSVELQPSTDQPTQQTHGVVYVQFHSAEDQSLAQSIGETLTEQGYIVPRIEKVNSAFSNNVRFFSPADQRSAEEVAGLVRRVLDKKGVRLPLKIQDLSDSGFKTPPGQLELWLNLAAPSPAG